MHAIATFFRNRSADTGQTYHFSLSSGKKTHDYSIYSRTAVDRDAFSDRSVQSNELDGMRSEFVKAVSGAGGGVIVTASGDGSMRHLEVESIAGDDREPAGKFVVLTPGYPAHAEPTQKKLKIAAAAHVIVPVDREAEERLRDFIGQLTWFSPDFESLILDALRRPSVDARLAAVEKELFGRPRSGAPAAPSAPGWGAAMLKGVRKPSLSTVMAAALIVLIFVASGVALHRGRTRWTWNDRTASPSPITSTASRSTSLKTSKDPAQSTADLASVTRALLNAVRERSNSNGTFKLLYEVHFRDFDEQKPTDAQIESWFTKQSPAASAVGSRPLLMGIIKLEALKLRPDPGDTTFLEQWDSITETKKVFKELEAAMVADAAGTRMLGAVSCRLGYSTQTTPGLPAVKRPPSPPFEFLQGTACDDLKKSDIEAGLEHLLEFVKQP